MSAPDHWTLTPDLVMLDASLAAETRLVYYAYLSYADRDGWCHPKQVTLAARLGMTRQTVAYHVQKLRDRHLLEIDKRGKLNHTNVSTPSTQPSIKHVDPIDTYGKRVDPIDTLPPERVDPIDTNDPTRRPHRREQVDPIDTNVSTPSTAERSHVERSQLERRDPETTRARARENQPKEFSHEPRAAGSTLYVDEHGDTWDERGPRDTRHAMAAALGVDLSQPPPPPLSVDELRRDLARDRSGGATPGT